MKKKKKVEGKSEKNNSDQIQSAKKDEKKDYKSDRLMIVVKVFAVICLFVLLGDILLVFYTKNKQDNSRTFFSSLNGYVYLADSYYGVGSNNVDSKDGYEKASLTKYDSKYRKVWMKKFNSKYNSTYYNIVSDGDYLLAVGSYEKTKEEVKAKLRTALFVKYDHDGKVIFKKDLQILGNSKFVNLLVLDDGYIVVGQSIYPNDVLGNQNTGGAIIIKYSKDGDVIWQQNVGGNKSGLFNDVIKSGDYLYAVGKDATRYGLVAKYSLDGEKIKAVSYAKTDTFGFSSIVQVGSNFICVGAKKVVEDDEYDHDTDGLLVEYNSDLEKKNEKTYKDTKNGIERFNKVVVDNDKNLVLVGHEAILDDENSTAEEYAYYYKSFIIKYDTGFKKKKELIYHEKLDDYFTDIELINGKYIVGGYTRYKRNRYQPIFIEYSKEFKR